MEEEEESCENENSDVEYDEEEIQRKGIFLAQSFYKSYLQEIFTSGLMLCLVKLQYHFWSIKNCIHARCHSLLLGPWF